MTRRNRQRERMLDYFNEQIDTSRSADCIKDAFRRAISYVSSHDEIVSHRSSWYCGLFWSGAEYDIILYDDDGDYRTRIYN